MSTKGWGIMMIHYTWHNDMNLMEISKTRVTALGVQIIFFYNLALRVFHEQIFPNCNFSSNNFLKNVLANLT